MIDQTPLTAEAEALLELVDNDVFAIIDYEGFVARLRAIEQAAARRAIEGSGVVPECEFPEPCCYRNHEYGEECTLPPVKVVFTETLAVLPRPVASPDPTSNERTGGVASPEEPRVERCAWCRTPIAEHPLTDACAIAQESEAR